jgi:hypothetical protein
MTNDEIRVLLYPELFGRRVLKSDSDWVWIHDLKPKPAIYAGELLEIEFPSP